MPATTFMTMHPAALATAAAGQAVTVLRERVPEAMEPGVSVRGATSTLNLFPLVGSERANRLGSLVSKRQK